MPTQTAATETGTLQLVVFSLSNEQYALPIERVQEIIRYTHPRGVASGDAAIQGVINLRGKIIPVYDLTDRLGCRARSDDAGNIIVVDTDEQPVGVIVDEVNEVRTIDRSQVDTLPTQVTDLIDGIVKLDDRLVILLNPDRTAND